MGANSRDARKGALKRERDHQHLSWRLGLGSGQISPHSQGCTGFCQERFLTSKVRVRMWAPVV